jgi:NADPH:quinone reductase-like Zn-dependent oxidoreductase
MPAVTTYPMGQVAQAHRDLESGATIGKLVLVP